MDEQYIKTTPNLVLKPNPYLKDPNHFYLYQKRMILMQLLVPRLIIGDDVGLGKTAEGIGAFTYIKASNPTTKFLVFTETLALSQWRDEILNLSYLKPKIITAETHPNRLQRIQAMRTFGADVLISTYSLIYDYWPYFLEGMQPRWVLFADEPNYFKNEESLLSKTLWKMINEDPRGPSRAYGATATIVENRLEEAFSICRVIAPNAFYHRAQFERDYCIIKRVRRNVKAITGYKNLPKFREQLGKAFYGRLAEDREVQQQLPEVITKDIPVIMGKAQSLKVLEAMDHILAMPQGEIVQLGLLQALTRSQQLTNDPGLMGFNLPAAKLEAFLQTVMGSLAGQKMLVFSKFRTMIDRIEVALAAKGVGRVTRITGAEDASQKEANKQSFLASGSQSAQILLMTRAGAKAANLQTGGHLFFFDMPWSYGLYRQIVGRLKRTGSQFKAIGVYRLLAELHPDVAIHAGGEKTIDHHGLETVMKKQKLWAAVTGDAETIETSSSDLLDIYEALRTQHRAAKS